MRIETGDEYLSSPVFICNVSFTSDANAASEPSNSLLFMSVIYIMKLVMNQPLSGKTNRGKEISMSY